MFGERPPRTQQIGKPLQSAGVQSVTFSVGRFTIRGTFCEVAASQSCLAGLIKCDGVANHSLSGELNLQSAEHFDQLNVAVKRGEIDWLHIVPEAHARSQNCIVTRCSKLCRVATRRHIWWSLESPESNKLCDYEQIKRLCAADDVHCIHATASRVWTHVPGWKCVDDFERLLSKFQQFFEQARGADHKLGELTTTMDEVTGAGEQQSPRAAREEENEACIGGLRNAARSVVKLPGWSLIGSRIALITEEMVAQTKPFYLRCWTIWATKTPRVPCQSRCVASCAKSCAPCWDSVTRCWHQDQVVSSLGCSKNSRWPHKTPRSTSTNGCEVPFSLASYQHSIWESVSNGLTTVCGPRNRSAPPFECEGVGC